MTLWLLRPADGLPVGDDPWDPWYDKAFGFVVRAPSEADARAFAHAKGGDENSRWDRGWKKREELNVWLQSRYTTCEPLTTEGEAGVVMLDFHSA